jgi:glucokinase
MFLAGDVGGTKTLLGLFARGVERPARLEVASFPTLEYEDLSSMVQEFLQGRGAAPTGVEAACFGVAGAVVENAARLTNVPWTVRADEVAERCAIPRVSLLNDLEAMATAVPFLSADELTVLQEGEPLPSGNAAVIAAGTGLGEAMLHNVDGRFIAAASEGGHADFAPRTAREIELLRELMAIYGRADWEHVISGPGLVNLYRFTHTGHCALVDATVDERDLPARISAAGLAGRCAACREALDLFVSIFGAEAGNLALRTVATAGVYVGGGIAPKILPAFRSGAFMGAFRAKPPVADLLATIPVSIILNAEAGLLGSAVQATTAR